MSDEKKSDLGTSLGLSSDLLDAVSSIVDKGEKIGIRDTDQYIDRVGLGPESPESPQRNLDDLDPLNEKKLTSKAREALSSSTFVFPKERKYPIPDASHARNALARVSQFGTESEQSKVKSAVEKKFPNIGVSEAIKDKKSSKKKETKKSEPIEINPTVEKFNMKSFAKDLHKEALEWGTSKSVSAYKKMTPGETPKLSEAGAREHFKKYKKKLGNTLPAINKRQYPEIRGLEGPFRFKKGQILYYDPKEGKYYDNQTDMYVDKHPDL